MSVSALDLALLLCSGATTSTSAKGFQGLVQRHDAGRLVAVVIGDQDFHGSGL
jgi:hypothetical protein